MASALYPTFKQALLNKEHDLNTDTIKACLVNLATDYTYSAAHDQLADVTKYAGTTDQTITSPTIASGVFDGNNVTFTAVAISGSKTVAALVVYNDTLAGDELICYIDGFTPITPNGGDIVVTWGANIFAL